MELLILENPDNTDCDKVVVCNIKGDVLTQFIVGFTNYSLTATHYEKITSEIVTQAQAKGLLKITLVQPIAAPPVSIFEFERDEIKNTNYFYYQEASVERANEAAFDPLKATNVILTFLNHQDQAFEWKAQQLVALQKRFDGTVIYTMIKDLNRDSFHDIVSRSPFVPKLNLVYDAFGKTKFSYVIAEGKQKKFALISRGDSLDELYQKLLDLLSGGQEQKFVDEDNELIISPDGTGCIFQGIPLIYENKDEMPKPPEKVEEKVEKVRRYLRDNAKSKEMVEEDEEDKKEGEAPPADDAK